MWNARCGPVFKTDRQPLNCTTPCESTRSEISERRSTTPIRTMARNLMARRTNSQN